MTVRLCRACTGFHALDEPWPTHCAGHFQTKDSRSIQIIKDIDPYKTIAADANGKPAKIGSRREHREFLKRNNYVEVGNDPMKPKAPMYDTVSGHEIRSVIERLQSRRS